MKKFFLALAIVMATANSSWATVLMFKSNQAEVNKGDVLQGSVLLSTTSANEAQNISITSKNGNLCRILTVTTATAFRILEGIKSGAISKVYCVTEDAAAQNSFTTKSYFLVY